MVREDQGKTGKFFHRVLQIPHCCRVLEYIRNGIAKKLENFASKNTREFILRHPVFIINKFYSFIDCEVLRL